MEPSAVIRSVFTLCVYLHLTEAVKDFIFYLSPHGKDTNSGLSIKDPLRTLNAARLKASVPPYRGNPIAVEMMEGSYEPVSFTSEDRYFSPVVFRPYKGQDVHISGGRFISPELFEPVKDPKTLERLPHHVHHMILQVDLWEAGAMDIGHLQQRGFYKQFDAGMELFFNGKPLNLASYPNEGYINVTSVPNGRFGKRVGFMDERPDQWEGETDVWVHGYWFHGWADFSTRVMEYDRLHRVLTLDNPGPYGVRTGMEAGEGGYFYFFNVLSELDQPGEYYIDREKGLAYIFPPEGHLGEMDVVIATEAVVCVSMKESANIRFENIKIQYCRGNGVFGQDTHAIAFDRVQISNTGAGAVYLYGDNRQVTISRSKIFHTTGGIYVKGGDRNHLKPSNVTIEDNFVTDTSRLSYTGQPAVMVEGVGMTVRHNELANVGSFALWWTGNNHVIENNRVHHACQDSSDCAALGSGLDWTYRGNIIRRNYIFHNRKQHPGLNARGILLDNQYSGALIEENVFYDNDEDIRIGGGRDNVVRHNVFVGSADSSVVVDQRGMGHCGPQHNETLFGKLYETPVHNEEWQIQYPELVSMLWDHEGPHAPKGNVITENVFTMPKGEFHAIDYCPPDTRHYVTMARNLKGADLVKDFTNSAQGDFRPNRNSPRLAMWREIDSFPEIPSPMEVGPRTSAGTMMMAEDEEEMYEDEEEHEYTGYDYGTGEGENEMGDGGSSEWTDEKPPLPAPEIMTNPDYEPKEGCYIYAENCAGSPELNMMTVRDDWGEMHRDSAVSEHHCFLRADEIRKKNCKNEHSLITMTYGPTGQKRTVGGDGCYIDVNVCKENDLYFTTYRDEFGEENFGTGYKEVQCLSRAKDVWEECGCQSKAVVTATFRPTGATRTVGKGCWITVTVCSSGATAAGTWYDGWGAANRNTDEDEKACARQAAAYWYECGADEDYPVKATYRPTGRSVTSGHGCWMETSYCPKLDKAAHFRDTWGEKKEGADSEVGCLLRAKSVYEYCGSDAQHPLTAVFRPTGAFTTVEAGCFLTKRCRKQGKDSDEMIRDSYGEEQRMAGYEEKSCLARAEEYHKWCKNEHSDMVTARYGPTGGTYTYP